MKKPTLVYIVGRGHSGSTLLELLLNRNDHVASMGEIDLLSLQLFRDENTRWIGRCSCGLRPYDCQMWGAIIKDVNKEFHVDMVAEPFSLRLSDVGTHEEFSSPGFREVIRYRSHRLIRTLFYNYGFSLPNILSTIYRDWITKRDFIAEKYAEYASADVVVDASKDHLHMVDINRYSKLPHKFIFLTRDVRGNVWSAIKREGVSAEKEAKDWARLNGRIVKVLRHIDKEKYIQVKYEDLCKNPDKELQRISEFVGIEYSTSSANDEIKKRHTIAGNKIRFKEISRIKQDLAWRDNLSKDDLSMVRRYAGPMANMLGYDLNNDQDRQ